MLMSPVPYFRVFKHFLHKVMEDKEKPLTSKKVKYIHVIGWEHCLLQNENVVYYQNAHLSYGRAKKKQPSVATGEKKTGTLLLSEIEEGKTIFFIGYKNKPLKNVDFSGGCGR